MLAVVSSLHLQLHTGPVPLLSAVNETQNKLGIEIVFARGIICELGPLEMKQD
jgi:hypothetical protein